MKDKKADFHHIRDMAYAWDAGMAQYFCFNNRILNKYGPDYAKTRMAYASGRFEDATFEPRYQHLLEKKESTSDLPIQKEALNVYEMQVPESEYEQWLHSVPMKDLKLYGQKKLLLDHYLDSFPNHDKNRIIKIMAAGHNAASYVLFIDLNPDLMTTQQTLIYKDIIRFYELENYNKLVNDKKLWDYFNDVNKGHNKEIVQNVEIDIDKKDNSQQSIIDEILSKNAELKAQIEINNKRVEELHKQEALLDNNTFLSSNASIDRLNSEANDLLNEANAINGNVQPTSNNNNNVLEQMNQVNAQMQTNIISNQTNDPHLQSLINMGHKFEDISKQLAHQRMLTEQMLKQQKEIQQNYTSNVDNFYNRRIRPLMFTPQTTVFNAKNIFGVNDEYMPRSTPNIIERNIILSNPNIAVGNYVDNIADLIAQRDHILLANNQLVDEIIRKQIEYNNQFISPNSHVYVQVPTTGPTPNNGPYASANRIGQQVQQANEVDANAKVPLSAIRNRNQSPQDSLASIFSAPNRSMQASTEEVDANKPKSLSSIIGRPINVNKVQATSTPNNTQVANISSQEESRNSEQPNKLQAARTPVATIRPYKPNLSNKIKKVTIPTKSFETSKIQSEPSMESREKILNNVSVNKEVVKKVSENKQEVKMENNATKESKISIPSKKLV